MSTIVTMSESPNTVFLQIESNSRFAFDRVQGSWHHVNRLDEDHWQVEPVLRWGRRICQSQTTVNLMMKTY